MKNKVKLFTVLIIFLSIVLIMLPVRADDLLGQVVESMKTETENAATSGAAGGEVMGLLSKVFTTLQYIGTGISLIIIMKLGISYMLTSVEEKAEIKKRSVPIIIGCTITIATVNILKIVQSVAASAVADTASAITGGGTGGAGGTGTP